MRFSVIQALTMLLAGLLSCGLAAAETRPFVPGSLEQIASTRAGRAFVLVMWSVDCTSCMRELDNLAAQFKRHPELELVMISTDEAEQSARVDPTLAKHGLSAVESWVFGSGNVRKLRHEIDKDWYGELPRSYFYDTSHQRVPLSGVISDEHIEAWIASLKR